MKNSCEHLFLMVVQMFDYIHNRIVNAPFSTQINLTETIDSFFTVQ